MSQHRPLVSYAQNFEDVMLWRALRHVSPGYFIDVGAQDPVVDSVSRLFNDFGWTGVHVEPHPGYAQALRESRPDDVVIQAAVGAEHGILDYFAIDDTGISTLVPEIAQQHAARGFKVSPSKTPVITLDDVFDAARQDEVHWLKIDVEGFEPQVLAGWQRAKLRPWVVVVESTLPMTQTAVFETWEPMLVAKGYRFAYGDGLNRFYVSRKHPELMAAFESPPNVFDGFRISGQASSPLHLEVAARYEGQIDQLKQSQLKHRQDLEAALQEARAQHAQEAAARTADQQARDELLRLTGERFQDAAQQMRRDAEDIQAGLQAQVAILRSELDGRRAELEQAAQRHAEALRSLIAQSESGLAAALAQVQAAHEQMGRLQDRLDQSEAASQQRLELAARASQDRLDEVTRTWQRDVAERASHAQALQAALAQSESERRALVETHRAERDNAAAALQRSEQAHLEREQRLVAEVQTLQARLQVLRDESAAVLDRHRAELAEQESASERAQAELQDRHRAALEAQSSAAQRSLDRAEQSLARAEQAIRVAEERHREATARHRAREQRLLALLDESATRLKLAQDQGIQKEAVLAQRLEAALRERDLARQERLLAADAAAERLAAAEARRETERAAAAAELAGLHEEAAQERSRAATRHDEMVAQHRAELTALNLAREQSDREWRQAFEDLRGAFDAERQGQEARSRMHAAEMARLTAELQRIQQHWLVRWLNLRAASP